MGCRKRAVRDCKRGTMACLGKELKVGKGRDLDSLGQKQVWEMRNKGIKGAWFCVNRFLVTDCKLTFNSISKYFPE